VKLISLPAFTTNGGPVQPVEAIGVAAREGGVWCLLDACQAAGHVPRDVRQIVRHMLTATSRKYLRGPRGVCFLYMDCELCAKLEPVFLNLNAATLRTPDLSPAGLRWRGYLSTSQVGVAPYPKVYDMKAMTPDVQKSVLEFFGKLHNRMDERPKFPARHGRHGVRK
jgi:selenocysteine lyase/cysteine desulfurase